MFELHCYIHHADLDALHDLAMDGDLSAKQSLRADEAAYRRLHRKMSSTMPRVCNYHQCAGQCCDFVWLCKTLPEAVRYRKTLSKKGLHAHVHEASTEQVDFTDFEDGQGCGG